MRIEANEPPSDPGLAIATKITASQQTVLDQLHNHVAFSETLIFLCGPDGAGKSTILEVFLEQASDYGNLAYIPQPSKTHTEALRSKILRQLVSLDAYSTDDSLLEALQRNIKAGRQHLVICVDNGATLPPAILSELQELVTSRHLFNPEHRVSVVIAGEAAWAKRAIKGLALGASEPPIAVQIPTLFKREQNWFARKLIDTQQAELKEQEIQQILATTQGYPGQIQRAMEKRLLGKPVQASLAKDETNPSPASLVDWKLVAIIVLAAMIALSVALWLHTGRDAGNEEEVESPVVSLNDANTPAETEPVEEASAEDVSTEEASSTVMDYNQAMTRLRQRAEQQPANTTDLQFQLIQPLNHLEQNPLSEAEEPLNEETTAPPEAEAASDEETEPSQANHSVWHQAYDNLELWQRDSSRYVLQVAAFNDTARLNQFLSTFEHSDQAIYHTLRNNQNWYIVLIGDFVDADSGRSYLENAAPELQAIQPWLKAMRLVHDDLAPVMDVSAEGDE